MYCIQFSLKIRLPNPNSNPNRTPLQTCADCYIMFMKENTEAASSINVDVEAGEAVVTEGAVVAGEAVVAGGAVVASDAPDGTAAPSFTQHVAVRAS